MPYLSSGLPGRARLSRPAESSSPFAPSNVFPSHGAQRQSTLPLPASPTPYVIPSQATRAIDRKRHDLVAYEYLCHVAEYVPCSPIPLGFD
jgi:Ras GTPase-activating-like protein IQGAP2/3